MAYSLNDLISAGVGAFGAALYKLGYSTAQIAKRVVGRYRDITGVTEGQASRYARATYIAAQKLNAVEPGAKILARDVPRGGVAGTGYRYWADVEIANAETGATDVRSIEVLSATNLTRGEMAERVMEIYERLYAPDAQPHVCDPIPIDSIPVGVTAYSIERY